MMRNAMYLILASLLAACASAPRQEQPAAAVEARPVAAMPPGRGVETRPVRQNPATANPLNDPASLLSKRSVYYDFDSALVKREYQPLVQAHSSYLAGHRQAKIAIQGNADERGSREYNLALGQKRAEAVKRAMVLLGVSPERIETVSLGEEKPAAPGHDEAAWALNRRSDIVYPSR
ncbi:MAG: peptidoglycan-associated lipoprotein Pal [Betaproteobacteria bacterium]|nr:peptidoglycan-associated lipoprotein Pal [Betaproteobacteria bacterium]